MKAKFRRGPLAGQIREIQGEGYRYDVRYPDPSYKMDFRNFELMGYEPLPILEGFYYRTNIETKKGIPVFEWMGHRGEVSG